MKKWLIAISFLAVVLVVITGCQGVPDEAKSQEIALSFLESRPTYKLDGVANIKLVETKALGNNEWAFTYEFACLHPGYGDRSGFPLYPTGKLTKHTARIPVIKGEVRSAYIDEVWDMQRQAYFPAEGEVINNK